jgi:hypothetical protein
MPPNRKESAKKITIGKVFGSLKNEKISSKDEHYQIRTKPGVFLNSRQGCMAVTNVICLVSIRPNLELKIWAEQLLGYLPLDICLHR